MATDTKASLKSLQQQVRSCESVFLPPDDLLILGIQATQIGIAEDGRLLFDPCFFQPHPERVLEKYPLDPLNMDEDFAPLNLRPDYDAFLEEISQEVPNTDRAVRLATERYNLHKQLYEEDWLAQSHLTWQHIDSHLSQENRKGLPKSLALSDLSPPRALWPSSCCSRDEHRMIESEWEVLEFWEDDVDDVQSSLMPHAIISVHSNVPADDAEASLTSYEVSAIVSAMICRKYCGPFRNHPIHPVLVLSYTGRNHGRIIQASYDGQDLALQYSPLWSFENEEMAPVELFVRYMMCESVGLENSPIIGPVARFDIRLNVD
ncbi:hypothetical protein N7474_008735 [Penicillium riverlandense]|uniref:uncharacterized protein n=1 Tax=Penicillium riverlandense TaxID=1903569 RepID=UPI00254926DA|nr:uncharacterized protein N7474_008735 [Penicillium riverlandense]KAJ5812434.1 hypothetical protein N7474_008735 [Penicillium riverlandense]